MSTSSYSYSGHAPSPPATPPPPPTMAYDPSPAIVEPFSADDYAADPSSTAYYASASTSYLPTMHPFAYQDASSSTAGRKQDAVYLPMPPEQSYALQTAAHIVPKKMVDMNFAPSGSTAAQPGIQTPLAHYTAQMVVWLWFGQLNHSSPSSTGSPINHDPFEYPRHPSNPLHPLQVAPSADFTRFVSRLLQITMVSHSVTLVALLYIYRLKLRYNIEAGRGTEMRPFIAALILANKYLDDNTYTNKTWAELTGLSVIEIGKMEIEFLRGLEYKLCVEKSEYTTWRQLLDGFILSRSHEGIYRSRFNPNFSHSPPSVKLVTPASAYVPSAPYVPGPPDMRARSVSPPPNPGLTFGHSPEESRGGYISPAASAGYAYTRKRSAVDAFAMDSDRAGPSTSHAAIRKPSPRKPQLFADPSGALYRSSSLKGRLPSRNPSGGRRGSAGNMHPHATAATSSQEQDLRHAAANHAAQLSLEREHERFFQNHLPTQNAHEVQEGWWSSLVAPCDQHLEAHAIPPEHLVFYTIAATPHPGQDGAPRKAILRHQQPHPYSYPPQFAQQAPPRTVFPAQSYTLAPQPQASTSTAAWYPPSEPIDDGLNVSPTAPYAPAMPVVISTGSALYPDQSYEGYYPAHHIYPNDVAYPYASTSGASGATHTHIPGHAVESEPAQFANAGPPGYIYNPAYSSYGAYPTTTDTAMSNSSAVPSQSQIPTHNRVGSDAGIEIAHFATATPSQSASAASNQNRWSATSEDLAHAYVYNQAHGQGHGLGIAYPGYPAYAVGNSHEYGHGPVPAAADAVRATRSEWSSPMPGYQGWQG